VAARAIEVAPVQPIADKPSVAVLPFVNMSGDAEREYFSDGITEDIIIELSRFRSLFVIARNSSFVYRGVSTDVRRVGRDLGVRFVVEGSFRRWGDRLRITAPLIEAATGNHLWAEYHDRDIASLFVVQDELARTITATPAGRLEDAELRSATRKRTDSLQAYDCVLRRIEHLQATIRTTIDRQGSCSSGRYPLIATTRWRTLILPSHS
jgi:adenylate cyclase